MATDPPPASPSIRAELVEDAGRAAADSGSFFRSPEFLAGEGTTHSLLLGDLAIPLIVRTDLPGGLADAISPYGYPGGTNTAAAAIAASLGGSVAIPVLTPQAPLDPGTVDWSGTELASVFLRDRIGPPPLLAGATERSVVQVHDPAKPRRIRPRLASQVRALESAGWSVDRTPGPDADQAAIAGFHGVYTQTMVRTGATPRYFFDEEYFRQILRFGRSWLLTAHPRQPADWGFETTGTGGFEAPVGGAGAIAVVSDGVLHYYLGGTADAAIEESPFKLVVAAMLDLADGLQLPLNLGGGLTAGDGLERFKRGFANATLPFNTHEIICDGRTYERLVADQAVGADAAAAAGFFPAYRFTTTG